MSGKKILILTNRIPYPLNDGGAIAMNAMIEGYEKNDWEVSVFSMNTSRHYVPVESLPPLYQKVSLTTFDINTDIRFVPVVKNFLLSRKPNQAERFFSKDFSKRLQKLIEDLEPDLIQIESIYLAVYIPAIRSVTKVNIALRLHNIEYQIWERLAAETQNSFKRYYLKDLSARIKKFEIQAWKQADILIPITLVDASVVSEAVPDVPLIVMPFGIDVKDIPDEQASFSQWIGYHIGAMDWLPNAEGITWFLEDVWPKLHKKIPSFEFHFAGRNMPASFKKYESEGVTCAGEVPDAQTFVSGKNMLIVPLKAGGGIRVKIMEAMAAGKLVVSTSIGMQGIEGAIPGTHYLNAETEDDFVDRVAWAITNREDAAKIAVNGARLIKEDYDRNRLMQNMIDKVNLISS